MDAPDFAARMPHRFAWGLPLGIGDSSYPAARPTAGTVRPVHAFGVGNVVERLRTGLAAALAVVALAGCGGGSSRPHRTVHLTAFERHGKALFIQTCGACHALDDAGTGGIAGPVLDSPWQAARVEETIADGPGEMPAGLLTGRAAAQVAAYVAAATR